MTLWFNLSACATGGRMYMQSFHFDTFGDSTDGKHPEAEILDYQYGDTKSAGTYADRDFKESASIGRKRLAGGMSGFLPRPEFLYLKWRMIESGEVYEDRVDLRDRLPHDMTDMTVHLVVRGPQLYVFLIYPWDGKPWERESYRTEFLPIPCGVKRFHGHKHLQIYPDPTPLPEK
jgi:hypothetical protein